MIGQRDRHHAYTDVLPVDVTTAGASCSSSTQSPIRGISSFLMVHCLLRSQTGADGVAPHCGGGCQSAASSSSAVAHCVLLRLPLRGGTESESVDHGAPLWKAGAVRTRSRSWRPLLPG